MKIGIPRYLIVGMAALFSSYHLVLGLYSLTKGMPEDGRPVLVGMALYLIATALSLAPGGPSRMPFWMAAFCLAVAVALPLLVTRELDPAANNGYATWHIAAVGTLMTIASTRRRHAIAWIGVSFLVVQTVLWSGGLGALVSIGVVGSVSWVAVSHILSSGMAKASRDAQRFAFAEREATDWQAAQEAHVFEIGRASCRERVSSVV